MSGVQIAARYQVAQAKAGSVDIESKIKALEQATSKSKKSSAVNKHKKEWLQESQRLSKLRDELEGELQEILDRLEQDRTRGAAGGGAQERRRSKEEEEQEEAVDMARQLAAIDFECKKARLLLFHELMADVEQSREVPPARPPLRFGPHKAYGAQLAEEAAAAAAEAATVPPLSQIEALEAPPEPPPAPAPPRPPRTTARPAIARTPAHRTAGAGPGTGRGGGDARPRLAALFVERFSELDLRYIGQLKGYKEELEAAEAAGRGPDAAAWDEPARFHFRKIYEEYEKKGLGRDAICERLALEMPARRRMDIEAFHDQHARQRYYHAKRKAALSAWGAAREALAREAERAFAESAEEEAARAEARSAEERAAREARRKLIGSTGRRSGPSRSACAPPRRRRGAPRRRRPAHASSCAAGLEEREGGLCARSWLRGSQAAAPRVAARAEERERKVAGERERAAERERERAEREARLARLRETVAPSSRGALPVHGYTVDQLFSDTRFKLTVALREAGLAHMPYAQEMIARAVPRTQPRVDSYTSGQLDAMAAAKMGLPPPP
eukprot:tig00021537_g22330.t1